MKIFTFVSILLLSVCSIHAQNPEEIVAWDEIDKTPVFAGCLNSENPDLCSKNAFIKFVMDEFNHELISGSKSN